MKTEPTITRFGISPCAHWVWKKYPKVIDAAKANSLLGAEGAKYVFNQDAVGFRHVKLSLDWVAESEQNEDGNLSSHIDNYTNTDVYEYIVELDADGKVIGGEWIGDHELTIRFPLGGD